MGLFTFFLLLLFSFGEVGEASIREAIDMTDPPQDLNNDPLGDDGGVMKIKPCPFDTNSLIRVSVESGKPSEVLMICSSFNTS